MELINFFAVPPLFQKNKQLREFAFQNQNVVPFTCSPPAQHPFHLRYTQQPPNGKSKPRRRRRRRRRLSAPSSSLKTPPNSTTNSSSSTFPFTYHKSLSRMSSADDAGGDVQGDAPPSPAKTLPHIDLPPPNAKDRRNSASRLALKSLPEGHPVSPDAGPSSRDQSPSARGRAGNDAEALEAHRKVCS